jgi:hypothetical protein
MREFSPIDSCQESTLALFLNRQNPSQLGNRLNQKNLGKTM